MIDALRHALTAAGRPEADAAIEPLADRGLAHWHLRLVGSGMLLRVPKQSQMGLAPGAHLAYEACCFQRAAPCGHSPRLAAVLPPGAGLPRGALLVDEVIGRPLQLPADLPALVTALAALHALPLPAVARRSPLLDPVDLLAALQAEIMIQAQHLPAARLQPSAARVIGHELHRLQQLLLLPQRPARHMIAFDAHPGNFLVDAQDRAWLVDLEKARYGAAALDLAHATLYTSTTWDLASQAVLDDSQVLAAARQWLTTMTPEEQAWVAPLRRAMGLWSLTWCAKWRVQSAAPGGSGKGGENWSTELSDAVLVDHVRGRVDHYLSPMVVRQLFDQCNALADSLRA